MDRFQVMQVFVRVVETGSFTGASAALGMPATVTYAFRANAPTTMPDDTSGFSRFNSAQKLSIPLVWMQ